MVSQIDPPPASAFESLTVSSVISPNTSNVASAISFYTEFLLQSFDGFSRNTFFQNRHSSNPFLLCSIALAIEIDR